MLEGEVVGPFEVREDPEGHGLAPVPEDDLQVGVAVEGAGQDQAQELNARLVVPADGRGREHQVDLVAETGIIRVADGALRDLRVDVERHAQLGRRREDRT